MCNLYSQTKSQDAMRHVFDDALDGDGGMVDTTGNLPPLTGIWLDYAAPIIRHGPSGDWRLGMARWGMPTPAKFLEGRRTDPGVTNIRNAGSPHWQRWLGIEHRCLVPFTGFSEIDARSGAPRNSPVWFALGEDRPLAFFAGLRAEWTSVRKLKEGEVTAELYGFLTCLPNAEVRPVHPKAMPVIRALVLCRSAAENGVSQRSRSVCQSVSIVGPSKKPTSHESLKTHLGNLENPRAYKNPPK